MSLRKLTKEEHYKETLEMIIGVAIDYDSFDTSNAEQMKGLVDDLVEIARDGVTHTPMWYDEDGKPTYEVEGGKT
jgi:hypothetical protein